MKIVYEKLDKTMHDREHFDCGDSSLNNFLLKQAMQRQKRHDAVTHVAVQFAAKPLKKILGFYSLVNNALLYSVFPAQHVKILPELQAVPSVKIARLARNNLYTNPGFGEYLLIDALKYIYKMATEQIGIYAIDVDVINPQVKKFYQKYGFIEFMDKSDSMFITIDLLKQIL